MRATTGLPKGLCALLPRDLISQALGDEESGGEELLWEEPLLSPRHEAIGQTAHIPSSPQVAPLESRLHSYKLTDSAVKPSIPVRLEPLLQEIDLAAEIHWVAQSLHPVLHLYPHLHRSGFFSHAVSEISAYRPLRAEAVSFSPSNKENLPNSS